MNTCENNDHYYYFYLYSDTGSHSMREPLRPLILVTFAKKKNTFSLIFQYSRLSTKFLDFFNDFFKSHRYAAT